jgi:hypothetical protein
MAKIDQPSVQRRRLFLAGRWLPLYAHSGAGLSPKRDKSSAPISCSFFTQQHWTLKGMVRAAELAPAQLFLAEHWV